MDRDNFRRRIVDHVVQYYRLHSDGVVCLWWPTASGKTNLSIQIAHHMRQMGMVVEIVSADSRQIYRHMNIGTDKVDFTIRQEIIHHQIDCVNPDQIYTAGQWKHDTDRIIGEITGVGHYPLIVWGTGLYIDTLYYNFTLPTIPANRNYRAYLEKLESDSLVYYIRCSPR